MSDQAINEMISAFAAGCMDKENYLNFVKYIRDGGELPYKELGKLQMLTSMLPVILDQETPPAGLKNRVAKSLIQMQDEIKEKIKSDRKRTVEVPKPKPAPAPKPDALEEPAPVLREENRTAPEPVMQQPHRSAEPLNDQLTLSGGRLFTETPQRQFEMPSFTPVWIVIALLIIALGALAYFNYSTHSELKELLSKAESDISNMKAELRGTSDYISRNSALVDFFNFDDIWVVQLNGVDQQKEVYGRLYVSLEGKEALLQMTNLPTPSPDNIYQLWMETKGQSYMIGSFFIEPASRYVKLTKLPAVTRDQVTQFKITLEPRGGSPFPVGLTYATSLPAGAQTQGRRR